MSRLSQNSSVAERMIGCVFAENFKSKDNIASNGGTLHGDPACSSKGVLLDGSSYVSYQLAENVFGHDEMSFYFKFTPSFSLGDGETYTLFHSTITDGGNGTRLYVDVDGALQFYVKSSTLVFEISAVDLASVWKNNAVNRLIIKTKSGDTSCWINGTRMVTNDTSTYVPELTSYITIGNWRFVSGLYPFEGTIHEFKVFNGFLDDVEAEKMSRRGGQFGSSQDLILPMTMQHHDPTNAKALDATNNNRDAALGDGSTQSLMPVKLAKKGYRFANDYMIVSSPMDSDDAFSVTTLVDITSNGANQDIAQVWDANGLVFLLMNSGSAGDIRFFVGGTSSSYAAISEVLTSGMCAITGTYFSGEKPKVYINGQYIAESSSKPPLPSLSSQVMTIGRRYSLAANGLYADMGHLQVDNIALTPIQVAELHERLMGERGLV